MDLVHENLRCWRCSALYKPKAQGLITIVHCKNEECGLYAHPTCVAKVKCCEVPDHEVIQVAEKRRN